MPTIFSISRYKFSNSKMLLLGVINDDSDEDFGDGDFGNSHARDDEDSDRPFDHNLSKDVSWFHARVPSGYYFEQGLSITNGCRKIHLILI